jgi:UPF0755 protein
MFGFGKGKRAQPTTEGDLDPGELYLDPDDEQGRVFPRSPSEAIQPEAAPPPPPRRGGRRNPFVSVLNGLISFLIVVLLIAGGIYLVGKSQFEAEGPLQQTRTVIIPQGVGVTSIAERLRREGVIADTYVFLAGVMLAKAGDKLKAGEYLFDERISMREVLDTLVEGRSILRRITIPEGRTSQQIVELLRAEPTLTGEIAEVPPEGTLLPETYSFTRGMTRASILQRMRRDMEQALARVWDQRNKDLPLKTPRELVTLASIVEKETGKADERPRVASVFVNRLRRDMRLQSDPTIIYGLVGGRGALGRPILKSEIDKPTPYNTYQIDGLPPGPIANPGLAALEATANPSRTKDLYFVADGTGGHAFAETLAEHNRNVANWRKVEAEMAAAAAARGESETGETAAGNSETGDQTRPANGAAKPTVVPPPPPLNLDLRVPGN